MEQLRLHYLTYSAGISVSCPENEKNLIIENSCVEVTEGPGEGVTSPGSGILFLLFKASPTKLGLVIPDF